MSPLPIVCALLFPPPRGAPESLFSRQDVAQYKRGINGHPYAVEVMAVLSVARSAAWFRIDAIRFWPRRYSNASATGCRECRR
ncbi:MAG: hypothetical protein OXU61_03215 [Gammaproteobacteria bacterium]|nr:hypothetical protein [Gammaproteobacteria bacterium]